MVPRLTTPKVTEAPATQDAQVLPTSELQSGIPEPGIPEPSAPQPSTHERPPGAARDGAAGARHFRSENARKVVAADVARDLVLQEIVQQARLTTTATGAFIAFARGHKIVSQATSGANAAEFVNGLNRHRRMVDVCLGSGTVQICKDSETSEDLNASACRYLGARSVVILPILDEAEKALGVFGAFSPQADGFSNANIVALQSLSRRIADAIAQLEKNISGSMRDGAAAFRDEPGEFAAEAPTLQSSRNPFAAFKSPAVLGVGILAVVLVLGWTVSRVISHRTAAAAANTPAATIPQATPAEAQPNASRTDSAVTDQSASPAQMESSAQPAPEKASSGATSGNATAASAKAPPVAVAVAKPSATIAPTSAAPRATKPKPPKAATAKPKPSAQAAARPGGGVPDLEIENALDDASSGQVPSGPIPSAPAGTIRSPGQPRNVPVPGSIPPSSIAPSSAPSRTTAANIGAPPTPYNSAPATSPHEAVRITRDPGPANAAAPAPAPTAPVPSASPPNAPARPGGPVMIPEATALERVVEKVKPDYPEEAMALNVQGAVVVDVVVGKTGLVENATPVDGDARLLASAVKAARKWQFAPLLRDNHFVSFETHLTLHFAIP
jgi:TonB family protein